MLGCPEMLGCTEMLGCPEMLGCTEMLVCTEMLGCPEMLRAIEIGLLYTSMQMAVKKGSCTFWETTCFVAWNKPWNTFRLLTAGWFRSCQSASGDIVNLDVTRQSSARLFEIWCIELKYLSGLVILMCPQDYGSIGTWIAKMCLKTADSIYFSQ